MLNLIKILFLISLFSCGKANQRPKNGPVNELLAEKYERIKSEAIREFDQETGWPSRDDCDGTLWAGLALASGIDSVKIELAEYSPGEIHRRPSPSCWDGKNNGSPTTISRDMLLGYMYGVWAKKDLEAAKRLAAYGESHFWKMGQPLGDGRVLLSGNGIGQLGRMIKALGGPDKIYRNISPSFFKSNDYELHLMLVGIALEGEINERLAVNTNITKDQKELLKWASENNPENATAQALWSIYNDGNFSKSEEILLRNEVPTPSYVRGHKNYNYVYWLFSAKIILNRQQNKIF